MNAATGRKRGSAWLAAMLLLLVAGCGHGQTAPRPAETLESSGSSAGASSQSAPPPAAADVSREETWEAAFIDDTRVGFTHTVAELVEEDGRTLRRTTSQSEMRLKRYGESVSQQLELTSWETPDGRLVRCETKLTAGSNAVVTRGAVDLVQGVLNLETTTLGKTLPTSIAWRADWGGFFVMEQSLRDKPMAPGEKRSLRALIPVFYQVGDIRLEAAGLETTQLLNEQRPLLKIHSAIVLGGQSIESVVWVDPRGDVLKSFMPGIGQTAYRVSRTEALAGDRQGQYDLGKASIVKVGRRLRHAHALRRVVYRATLDGADPLTVFPSSATQHVRRVDGRTVEIDVVSSRAAPARRPGAESASPPTAADLAPNNLIQSDSPRIVEMAKRAAPDETNPWKIALALEKLAHRSMRNVNFSKTFATAAEVAETLEGDCTEHAVLLAAICRARGIPARVVIGLVYYANDAHPEQEGFAYHMWNEAWADGGWRPLDATLGLGGVGATHLKLGDSNLQGADAYAAFLPVYQVLGRLRLEIVEVDDPTAPPDASSSDDGGGGPLRRATFGQPSPHGSGTPKLDSPAFPARQVGTSAWATGCVRRAQLGIVSPFH